MKVFLKLLRKILFRDCKERREFLLKMMPRDAICAEIGVWKGTFSEKIIKTTNPRKLHLIDPWRYQKEQAYQNALYGGKAGSQEVMDKVYGSVIEKFKNELQTGRIIVHRKTSEEASKDFPDEYFDWVYIDGDHQYEFVKSDLELFGRKVKKSGFISGDNYNDAGWWKGGVKKAVDEFIKKEKATKIKIKSDQFILRK